MEKRIIEWLLTGDVGTSSRSMVALAMGIKLPYMTHPMDPSDFGRCVKLLAAVPELRECFAGISMISPAWGKLIAHWAELEELYKSEIPTGKCSGTYQRMREILR